MDGDRVGGFVGFEGAGAPGGLEHVLWLAVALALVGDVATTLVGLRLGLVESNPVARGAIAAGGLPAMVALKAGAVGVGLACRPLLPRAYARSSRPVSPAPGSVRPRTTATCSRSLADREA